MALDLQELLLYVTDRYPSSLSETSIEGHVNEVYRDLSQLFTPENIVVESGLSAPAFQEEITVPVGARSIRRVYLGTGANRSPLRSISRAALNYPRADGTPRRWFYAGTVVSGTNVRFQIGLDPLQDGGQTLTVEYEPEPEVMSADTDVPVMVPTEHHHLIAWGAIALVAGQQQDYTVAQNWEVRYRAAFNEIGARLGRSGIESRLRAQGGGGQ